MARLVEGGKLVTLTMRREDAAKLLATGTTVSVYEPECLGPFAREFARALHVPNERLEFNAYLSRAGGFTPSHFDATESIIIQVRGTKIWRLAKNEIVDPLKHAARGGEPPPALRLHHHGDWPRDTPPSGEIEIEAHAGSVLYLPRGFWHETATVEDSLSLHFHYGTEAFLDVLWPVLYRELARDPAWRRAAWGPNGRRTDEEAQAHVTELLAKAARVLSQMQSEDVLCGSLRDDAGEARAFRRRAGVGLGVERTVEGGDRVVRVIVPEAMGDRVAECEIAPELASSVLWIAARELWERFKAEDVPRSAGLSLDDVGDLLRVLEETGAVAPESP
jgi:hypothetical protein